VSLKNTGVSEVHTPSIIRAMSDIVIFIPEEHLGKLVSLWSTDKEQYGLPDQQVSSFFHLQKK
jgi:hypothetical protein